MQMKTVAVFVDEIGVKNETAFENRITEVGKTEIMIFLEN